MVCWASRLRTRGRGSMVGGGPSSLMQRLAGTRMPSLITPMPPSALGCTMALFRRPSSVACSSTELLSQWRYLSSGSMCRTAVERYTSFFGGDVRPLVGAAVPDAFGQSIGGVRMMGGGPRTFPGGVSKWQWKRMQDKKERQIERARLLRERHAYEERRRQELLAASPRMEKPWEERSLRNPLAPPSAALDPQVRALADRFRRPDGEDTWNEADGPITTNGLPSLASAHFRPERSRSSSFAKDDGPNFDRRAGGRVSARSQLGGASHDEELPDRFTGGSRAAVAAAERSIGETIATWRIASDGVSSRRGASSGIREKSDNLSLNRNFSSTSSGAAFLEDIPDERKGGRERQSISPREGLGRQPSERGRMRPASGQRFAEAPQVGFMERTVPEAEQQRKRVKLAPSTTDTNEVATPSHLSETRFDDYQISDLSVRALHDVMGYQKMTKVQEATFPLILEGKDVLAKAKTGTGKTIAFLLPAIEAILNSHSDRNLGLAGRSPINVLIICPTRELASQAAMEAKTLMTYHKKMDAQIVIGGTNMNSEVKNLEKHPCQVLVATPGRLLDHMSAREFRQQLNQLKVLVLDEADRLLDMGFRRDLEKIIRMLPPSRQTLLFSATVPNEVHKVSEVALKKGHIFVDTVGKDTEDTHAKVQQRYAIVPLEDQMGAVYTILETHMNEEEDYKVLVFCTTARSTALMAELSTKLGLNTLEIHSRKSQAYRTRVSDTFRKAEGGVIMFTSDVSARGVDYPDITLVIQLGIPAGREEYVHRLGRTGRAGKEGQGVLILAPWEQQFLKALKDIPIVKFDLKVDSRVEDKVNMSLDIVKTETKEKAYQAWLGYYNSAKMLSMNKTELVRLANHFSFTLGMDEPPILMKKTIGMMGLRGVEGLRSA